MSRKERKTTIINTIKLQKRLQIKTRSHQTRANRNVKCLRRTSTVKFDFYSRVTLNESWEVSEWVWQRSMCPRWSSGYETCLDSERPLFDLPLTYTIFFGSHHIFNSLLHLVASVIFKFDSACEHAFTLEEWMWQQSGILRGLVVVMLTWDSERPRFRSPSWGTQFFSDRITYSTPCYISVTLY